MAASRARVWAASPIILPIRSRLASPVTKLLGISGSLRRGSYCTAVLRTARDASMGQVEIDIFDLSEIPLFNQDQEETAVPAAVHRLKESIAAADGLIVISPEYNHGMPGVLKNAIDWVSRPGYSSILVGKPVLLLTASPTRFGGVRAHVQLLETFASTLSRIVTRRQIAITDIHKKVEHGKLTDTTSLQQVLEGVGDLTREIAILTRGQGTS
jgi:chromate reductase